MIIFKCNKCGHEQDSARSGIRCDKCLNNDTGLINKIDTSVIDNLRSQLNVKEKEIQNLTKRCDDMASQLEQLQELVTNLRTSSEKLIAQKGQVIRERNDLTSLVENLQDTIKVLSQKNTELAEQIEDKKHYELRTIPSKIQKQSENNIEEWRSGINGSVYHIRKMY